MVTDTGKQTPYAALAPVIALIRRRRERSLPDPLNTEKLIQLGISEGNISRVLQTLRFLNLIDEEGYQTEGFNRIARAKEQEYPDILAEIIKGAYHDVFNIIGDDLNQVTDIELNDAFRLCQPESQRNRMIILFRGLCQEAGLIAGGPPETHMRSRTTGKPSPSQTNGAKKTLPKSEPSQPLQSAITHPVSHHSTQPDFVLLQNLIKQLPSTGKWTQARRDKWIKAVEANVDVLIDIVDYEEEDEE